MEKTLTDYLAPNLDVGFVGINPGEYSTKIGHYFARKQNTFRSALNQSGLVNEILTPEDDHRWPQFGLGLTDIVKQPTARTDQLEDDEFKTGGRTLRKKLEPLSPLVICFVGREGYRKAFDRNANFGLQSERWGKSALFILPSTSPLNAHHQREMPNWFKQVKILCDQLKGAHHV